MRSLRIVVAVLGSFPLSDPREIMSLLPKPPKRNLEPLASAWDLPYQFSESCVRCGVWRV